MNSTASRAARQPRIVITLADVTRADDPVLADDKNELYIAAIRRAGGEPLPLNERSTDTQRRQAFAMMDGLLLSGGADIDPARYGQPMQGARDIQPERDQLEIEALAVADTDRLPVLGICRGLQALNAFRGGTLIQHLDGHEAPDPLLTGLARHDLEIRPGSTLAGILLGREVDAGATRGGSVGDDPAPEPAPRLVVNSYHHQGVPPEGLAPGLVSAGTAEHSGGILVEALETIDPERFLIGVQCHPERLTSTPPAFARLFRAFVQAAAIRASGRDSARNARVPEIAART